jgi:hypothetical protein
MLNLRRRWRIFRKRIYKKRNSGRRSRQKRILNSGMLPGRLSWENSREGLGIPWL